MAAINPRPGVVVAVTDRRGELACYDPNAYRRRDYYRSEKIREHEEEDDEWDSKRQFPARGKSITASATSRK